jgi:hypothetical protein
VIPWHQRENSALIFFGFSPKKSHRAPSVRYDFVLSEPALTEAPAISINKESNLSLAEALVS